MGYLSSIFSIIKRNALMGLWQVEIDVVDPRHGVTNNTLPNRCNTRYDLYSRQLFTTYREVMCIEGESVPI